MSSSTAPRSSGRRSRFTGLALAALLALVALVPAAGASAQGGAALLCDQKTLYAIGRSTSGGSTTSGVVRRLDLPTAVDGTAASDSEITLDQTDNALGIAQDGLKAYAFKNGGSALQVYDPRASSDPVTSYPNALPGNTGRILRGAVDPVSGIYYYATGGTSVDVYGWNPASSASIGLVARISGTDLQDGNGDFAFSSSGVLFLAAKNKVLRLDGSLPTTTQSTPTALTSTTVATLPDGVDSPGIAFSSDGYLYVVVSPSDATVSSYLLKLHPGTGAQASRITVAGDSGTVFRMTDLASCNYANTVTGRSAVSERVRDTDQFTVAVGGGGISSGNTATSSGSASSVTAGPVLGLASTDYTVTQSAAGTTDLNQYTTSWTCARATDSGTPLSTGTTSTASFTMPTSTGSHGTDVTCTFSNTPKTVQLRLKSALDGARIDGTDQFTASVSGASATTSGTGATVTGGDTGARTVVVGRPYDLVQTMSSGSKSGYGHYAKTISCTDVGSGGTTLPSGDYSGSTPVTPKVGADINCTVTAKAAPASIAVTTSLADPRYTDDDQFTATIHDGSATVGTGTPTTTGTGSTITGGTGTTTWDAAVGGRTYTVTHTTAPAADVKRYTRTVTCTDAKGFQDPQTPTATEQAFAVATVPGAQITCAVRVQIKGSGLQVETVLGDPRFDDGDQFTAAVGPKDGAPLSTATTTGADAGVASGGTTAKISTTRDAVYTITDSADQNPERYERSLTCQDANGLQSPLPSGAAFSGSFDITPQPGADLLCTVRFAAKRAVLSGTAALGSERFADGDQFRVALQQGSTVLGQGTTTGSGSSVDTGSGSTGDLAVPRGDVSTILGAPTLHPERYDRTVSCTDRNHLQTTGLPDGAFNGSADFTPEAGTAIACTVTSALKPAALTVTTALADPRVDDADQWTVAWRTGGPSGAVLDAGPSTTSVGSGRTIAPGTGVSGPIAATHAVAYTLTESTSGAPARYATTLTCEDRNDLQHGLPSNAVFTGAATVIPEASADVRCVLTTALAPASLALHLAGPAAAQVEQAATWVATLTNDGGAAAEGRVTLQVPQGLAFQAARGTGWRCTLTGRILDCIGPDLAGGASESVELDLVPARGSEGEALLRGVVDPLGAGADLDPTVCTGSGAPDAGCDAVRTVVGSTPHLVLGITGPGSAAVGVPASWTATVRNDGTGAAGTATVAFRLPDGLQRVTVDGADCTVSGRDAVCSVPGPIAVGATRSFTVAGTPTAATAALALRGRLDPRGSATTGDPARCTADDAATGCAVSSPVAVTAGVALAVTITPPTALTEGVPAGYAVGVRNTGTGPAASPVVSVHLPDGLAYRGAAGAACERSGQDLTCTLPGVLPAGGSSSFVVTVQPVDGTAGTEVAPAASVDPTGGDRPAAASGCTATAAGCAISAPRTIGTSGLVLTGTVTPLAPAGARLAAGDRVRYGFTVANRTGTPLSDVVVTVPGLGIATCAATVLAPGASTTCTLRPVTVTQAQVDAGSVARDAVATGVPEGCTGSCAPTRSNRVTLTAPVRAVARIAAVQTVSLHDSNGDGVAQLGERVTFSVRVTNTGTVTLHGVALDDAVVHLVCPRTTLAVGESMVCTGDHVTTAADVAAGGIRNVATASARGVARLGTVSSQRTVGAVEADGPRAALAHTGSSLPTGLIAGFSLLGAGGLLLVGVRRRRSV